MNLNVALAYVRLGNYLQAKKFYSDQDVLQYKSIKAEYLPGTDNIRLLEASILLGRGLDTFFTGQKEESFDNFAAANKIVPENG